jgi:arsenite-transporting ATPase
MSLLSFFSHHIHPSLVLQIILLLSLAMFVAKGWLTRLPITGRIVARPSRSLKFISTPQSPYLSNTFRAFSVEENGLQNVALATNKSPQFVFVGGKGGVGKTTTSSAVALALSDRGYRTLVVSTDPAHSLGDALDTPLRSGVLTQIHSEESLWALELDVEQSLQNFKKTVQGFDGDALSRTLGIPKEIIDSFGLNDMASIFSNPPPGIDEVVGLAQIFRLAELTSQNPQHRFDRIVVDTAPTGHTLRLLQLPEFLGNLTIKLMRFRAKIESAVQSFKSLLGNGNNNSASAGINHLLQAVEKLQQDMLIIKTTLKDEEQTQFVVVTIPTMLAVEESKRLVKSLKLQEIRVSTLLCNQVIDPNADEKYLRTRSKGQQVSLELLKRFIGSTSMKQSFEVTEVPFLDTEVTGIYGLRFFSRLAHPNDKEGSLSASNPMDSRPLTIFGGKGGVGKTTSAASWAVRLADAGHKTLVVSCDPAHSLGDALQENLNGGVPRLLDTTAGGGQLWAMEIDPMKALDEFKQMMKSQLATGSSGSSSVFPNMNSELSDLLYDVNDPPPGTDEIVAMTKIMTYLDEGYRQPNGKVVHFDKIVLDTAPTGHTLRMLDLPKAMKLMVSKVKKIRQKTSAFSGLFGGRQEQQQQDHEASQLRAFEEKMDRLDDLLHNEYESEFTIVTIPTELAVAETKRLIQALETSRIPMRRVIVNQILPKIDIEEVPNGQDAADIFLNRLRTGQGKSLQELDTLSAENSIPLIKIPYYDAEVRSVYGLKPISDAIFYREEKRDGDNRSSE